MLGRRHHDVKATCMPKTALPRVGTREKARTRHVANLQRIYGVVQLQFVSVIETTGAWALASGFAPCGVKAYKPPSAAPM